MIIFKCEQPRCKASTRGAASKPRDQMRKSSGGESVSERRGEWRRWRPVVFWAAGGTSRTPFTKTKHFHGETTTVTCTVTEFHLSGTKSGKLNGQHFVLTRQLFRGNYKRLSGRQVTCRFVFMCMWHRLIMSISVMLPVCVYMCVKTLWLSLLGIIQVTKVTFSVYLYLGHSRFMLQCVALCRLFDWQVTFNPFQLYFLLHA